MSDFEKYYEETFNEPWSELERRVRRRHPVLFSYLDKCEEMERRMDEE